MALSFNPFSFSIARGSGGLLLVSGLVYPGGIMSFSGAPKPVPGLESLTGIRFIIHSMLYEDYPNAFLSEGWGYNGMALPGNLTNEQAIQTLTSQPAVEMQVGNLVQPFQYTITATEFAYNTTGTFTIQVL